MLTGLGTSTVASLAEKAARSQLLRSTDSSSGLLDDFQIPTLAVPTQAFPAVSQSKPRFLVKKVMAEKTSTPPRIAKRKKREGQTPKEDGNLEYVEITPEKEEKGPATKKARPILLTEHQKEVLEQQQRTEVAFYNTLEQSSQDGLNFANHVLQQETPKAPLKVAQSSKVLPSDQKKLPDQEENGMSTERYTSSSLEECREASETPKGKKSDAMEVVTNLVSKVAGGSQSEEIDVELVEFSNEALLSAQANLTVVLSKITAKLQENLVAKNEATQKRRLK